MGLRWRFTCTDCGYEAVVSAGDDLIEEAEMQERAQEKRAAADAAFAEALFG